MPICAFRVAGVSSEFKCLSWGVLVKYSLLSYPGGNASPFCGILKLNIKDLLELRTLGNPDVRWSVIKGVSSHFVERKLPGFIVIGHGLVCQRYEL